MENSIAKHEITSNDLQSDFAMKTVQILSWIDEKKLFLYEIQNIMTRLDHPVIADKGLVL